MQLNELVPIYNEEAYLHNFLHKLNQWGKNTKHEPKFVLLDDGSSDNTSEILSKWNDETNLEVMLKKHQKSWLGRIFKNLLFGICY